MTEEIVPMIVQSTIALGVIVTLTWIGFGLLFILDWRKRKKESKEFHPFKDYNIEDFRE